MKRYILTLLLAGFVTLADAQYMFNVWFKDGGGYSFELSSKPVLTRNEDLLEVTTNAQNYTFNINDIQKFTFAAPAPSKPTGIKYIEQGTKNKGSRAYRYGNIFIIDRAKFMYADADANVDAHRQSKQVSLRSVSTRVDADGNGLEGALYVYQHYTDDNTQWSFPIFHTDWQQAYFDTTDKTPVWHLSYLNADGEAHTIPYNLSVVDSVVFSQNAPTLPHDRFEVYAMQITTEDGAAIDTKENWINCHISINGKGHYDDFSGTGRIRGRGNSTWLWYDKKPYKFKLDTSSKILGMKKNRDWNLLANRRDVTQMMNAVGFELSDWLGMPFSIKHRYVEVFLNGNYIGSYQLTEKIEVGSNRVDISEDEGILLSIDLDDGPSLSPEATDNFWSKVYSLPICVKYPDEVTEEQKTKIRDDFAILEQAIKSHDLVAVDSLMDLKTFMNELMVHEYLYNVEIDAPRSIYLFRDKDGKYTWGPMWDFDGGFGYSWQNMSDSYRCHNFFLHGEDLIMGTKPYDHNGTYDLNNFFTELFACPDFVKAYKKEWSTYADSLFDCIWERIEEYVGHFNSNKTYTRNDTKWQHDKTTLTEVSNMQNWLSKRTDFVTKAINNYPENEEKPTSKPIVERVGDYIQVTATLSYAKGYDQAFTIDIPEEMVAEYFSVDPSALTTKTLKLVPLNANGTEGTNTAAGTYGAWFNASGNTCSWNNGDHVFIESNNLYTWSCGLHQSDWGASNCAVGDKHTVAMQYKYSGIKLKVKVNFTIGE